MKLSPELGSITGLLSAAVGLPGPSLDVRARAVEWWRWVVLTDEHQLGPFLASRLVVGQHTPSGLPRVVEGELADRYARTGHEAAFRDVELVRVLELFEPAVTPLVLKGSALVHTLYGEGAERPMSDVDLLFRSDDALTRARARLVDDGYSSTRGGGTPEGHHHVAPLVHPTRQQTLELHTNLATPGLPPDALGELWRRRRGIPVGGVGRFQVLDPVSALLHHAVHAAADPVDAPLLRNVFEVAWMTSLLDRADRAKLKTLAEEWGVERRVAPIFELTKRLFGAPRAPFAADDDRRVAWGLRRIEWSGARAPKAARFFRDVARRYFAAIDRGRDPAHLGVAIAVFVEALGEGLTAKLRALVPRRRPRRIGVAEMPGIIVEGCLLAHDVASGAVHLLDRVSTEVWAAAGHTADVETMSRELRAHGLDPKVIRHALTRLVAHGLVVDRGIEPPARPTAHPRAGSP